MNNNNIPEKLNTEVVKSIPEDNTVIIPSINPEDNTCITNDNVIIYDCTIDDKGNIKGFTKDHVKAFYNASKDKWFFGQEIGYSNLINLSSRTAEERRQIGSLGAKKRDENREQKKNVQELAKAMLELTMKEDQIRDIVGEDIPLLDNSVASAMIGAMIKSALSGSFKAFEAVRDTAGYKPKNEVELQADIMTESDKALIDKAIKAG